MSEPRIPVSFLRRLHAGLTVVWLILAIPAILLWRNSIAFLVFVSIYANVASHFSAWQGARSEAASGEDS